MNRTFGAAIIVAATALVSVGCTNNSAVHPIGLESPQRVTSQVRYTAVGASDAVGVGATQCKTAGTPPMPAPPSCPGGTGYVPDLATLLTAGNAQVHLFDFGISGAVIGPDIQADTTACFNAPGNFITNELPVFNSASNLVTIFAGGNDTKAIVACSVGIAQGGGDPTPFIASEIAKFGADYAALVQGVKKTSPPGVTIVVSNLPNLALIPRGQAQPPFVQALLAEVSLALDQTIINPSAGVTVSAVVDALCTSSSYDPVNFSADGFHPSAAGYTVLANDYYAQVLAARAGTAQKPATSCPPITAAIARRPMTASDAANVHLWRY